MEDPQGPPEGGEEVFDFAAFVPTAESGPDLFPTDVFDVHGHPLPFRSFGAPAEDAEPGPRRAPQSYRLGDSGPQKFYEFIPDYDEMCTYFQMAEAIDSLQHQIYSDGESSVVMLRRKDRVVSRVPRESPLKYPPDYDRTLYLHHARALLSVSQRLREARERLAEKNRQCCEYLEQIQAYEPVAPFALYPRFIKLMASRDSYTVLSPELGMMERGDMPAAYILVDGKPIPLSRTTQILRVDEVAKISRRVLARRVFAALWAEAEELGRDYGMVEEGGEVAVQEAEGAKEDNADDPGFSFSGARSIPPQDTRNPAAAAGGQTARPDGPTARDAGLLSPERYVRVYSTLDPQLYLEVRFLEAARPGAEAAEPARPGSQSARAGPAGAPAPGAPGARGAQAECVESQEARRTPGLTAFSSQASDSPPGDFQPQAAALKPAVVLPASVELTAEDMAFLHPETVPESFTDDSEGAVEGEGAGQAGGGRGDRGDRAGQDGDASFAFPGVGPAAPAAPSAAPPTDPAAEPAAAPETEKPTSNVLTDLDTPEVSARLSTDATFLTGELALQITAAAFLSRKNLHAEIAHLLDTDVALQRERGSGGVLQAYSTPLEYACAYPDRGDQGEARKVAPLARLG